MKRRIVFATFAEERSMLDAAHTLLNSGLKIVDVHMPYADGKVEEVIPAEKDHLSVACLAGGVTGLVLALGFQLWTSVIDWPLNVGGKPFASLPALIPVTFEITILFGAIATLAVFLTRGRLGPGRISRPEFSPASDDRFVLEVEILPGRAQRCVDVLESAGASDIQWPEGNAP